MKSWIEREFSLEGVLAAGGGSGTASAFSVFATGELVLAHNEEVWRGVAASLARLQTTGAPVDELVWGFERAMLCTIQRDDGAWLGVFTVSLLPDGSALALRAKLDEFKEQTFGNAG